MRTAELLTALLLATACRERPPPPAAIPAAKVSNAKPESTLSTLTLTDEATKRLGLQTAAAEQRSVPAALSAAGEVVLPPGMSLVVSAPISGTVARGTLPQPGAAVSKGQTVLRLAPLPSAGELASAQIRLDAAVKRRDRAAQLLEDGASSKRALEEAEAELAVAQGNAGAATGDSAGVLSIRAPHDGVLRDLQVGVGQAVAAGAPLFQLDGQRSLWVKVPLYVGHAPRVDRARAARVTGLAERGPGVEATAIAGPLTGNAEAASEDLFYLLPATGFRPTQRVLVSLPLKSEEAALVVPWSSVLFDLSGGTWVYVASAPNVYARRRVRVLRVADGWAVLERGLTAGERVVSVGAEELFGTEFGAGK